MPRLHYQSPPVVSEHATTQLRSMVTKHGINRGPAVQPFTHELPTLSSVWVAATFRGMEVALNTIAAANNARMCPGHCSQ